MKKGKGFVVDDDYVLTCYLLNRRVCVPIGFFLLLVFAFWIYAEWTEMFAIDRDLSSQIGSLMTVFLLVALVLVGGRKEVIVSKPDKMVRRISTVFGHNALWGKITRWEFDRFDRIIVHRTNLVWMDAPDLYNPKETKRGIRFRVKLVGDSEVEINSYRHFKDARELALAVATVTNLPLKDVN